MSPSAENGMKQILLHTHALHLRPCAGDVESPTSNGTWGMSPGVCTAPVPAPERDCPSEGCQLAVRKNRNYEGVQTQGVGGKREGETSANASPPRFSVTTLPNAVPSRRQFFPLGS